MLNVETVATPLTAFPLVVPARVPPPGSAPSPTVIDPVNPVTTFPASSSAATRTAGIVCPACVVCGCVVKATWVARSDEDTSELQSHSEVVCSLLPEENNV